MVALETPVLDGAMQAPEFSLKSTDGNIYNLGDVKGENGLVVMFICNHCPYVKALLDKIVRDANDLLAASIGVVAIMSNNPDDYEEDSFENMQKIAKEKNFPFQYLIDETQEVAKSYGAVCTPDFFGFDSSLQLKYRGRLDGSGIKGDPDAKRELFDAMIQIKNTGQAPAQQKPSIGCSVKWR